MSHRQLDTMIQQMFDGQISKADFSRLQNILLEDPAARQLFYDYGRLHQGLRFRYSVRHGQALPGDSRRWFRRSRFGLRRLLLAAAAVVLAALVLRLAYPPTYRPTVTFRSAPGTVYTVAQAKGPDGKPSARDALEPGSSLKLNQGTVELNFARDVTAVVRAPAVLSISADDHLMLKRGKAWFRVGKDGRGFRVTSNELAITDLGTEFGVIAADSAPDEVHCFTGEVIARANAPQQAGMNLLANQAVASSADGTLNSIPPRPEEFLTSLPSGPTYLHWSFDEQTEDGWQVEGEHPAAGSLNMEAFPSNQDLSTALVPGRFGKALRFDGRSNHVVTDWPGVLGDDARSVACWFRMPADQTDKTILLGWGIEQNYPELSNLKFTVGFSRFRSEFKVPVISFGGTRYYAFEARVADGEWHHLACSYRGGPLSANDSAVTLYLDGQPATLTFVDATGLVDRDGRIEVRTSARTPLVIGAGPSASGGQTIANQGRFMGELDELYIFDSPIDHVTVKRLHQRNRADEN